MRTWRAREEGGEREREEVGRKRKEEKGGTLECADVET